MLLPVYQPRDSVALTGQFVETASQTALHYLQELADLGFPLGETITAAESYARLAGWQDVHADSLLLEQANACGDPRRFICLLANAPSAPAPTHHRRCSRTRGLLRPAVGR